MSKTLFYVPAALGLALACAAVPASAQKPAPGTRAVISKDPTAAPPGLYALDPDHSSVIVRATHAGGLSWSVFRFSGLAGTLDWDPVKLERSRVEASVEAKSIGTPVTFNQDLTEARFLNAAKYPTIRFVSTAVRRTGPTTGQISGNLTFYGVTRPVVIEAELVGAGLKADKTPGVGFHGTFKFKRSDYGFSYILNSIGDEIEVELDAEFTAPAPAH